MKFVEAHAHMYVGSVPPHSSPRTDVRIFKRFLPKKVGEQIGVFDSKHCQIMQKLDHDIGSQVKRQLFRQKIAKFRPN
jgi:hypothetical protein